MVQKKSNPKKTAPKAESTAEEPKKKVVARKTATKSAKDDQPAVEPKAKAKSSKKAEPESTVKTEPVAETKKTVKSKKVTATAVEEMPKAVEPKPKAAAKKKTIPPKEAVPDVEVQPVAEPAAEPKKTKKKTAKADAKPAAAPVEAAPEVVAQPVAEPAAEPAAEPKKTKKKTAKADAKPAAAPVETAPEVVAQPVAEPAAEPAAAPKKTKKKTTKADAKPEAAPVEAAPEVVAQPAAEPAAEPAAAPKKSKKKTAKADANQVPVEEPKAVEAVEEVQKETPKKRSARLTAPRKGNKVIVEDYIMEEAYSGTFQPIVRAKEDPVSGIAKKPVPVVDESNIDANIPVEEAKKTVRKPRTKRAAKVDLEDFISKEPDSPSVEDLPSETSKPDEPEVENTAAVEAVNVPKKKGGRKPNAKKAKKGDTDGLSSNEASEDVSLDLDKQEPSAEDLENLPEEVFDEMEAVKAKSRKPEEPKVLREPRPREDRPANVYEVESVLDINSFNIWNLNEFMIAELWENERKETDFSQTEEKLLNIIRTAFDLVHYDEGNARDKALYDNGDWAHFSHCRPGRGTIAIRRRLIRKLTDLTYENIRHITAPTLLELIDRNFGGGWDSISLSIKDIIESGFDISTTQLPANRIHLPGGTLERKVAQGYDVLELARGTWIEAIFAKKKDPIEKLHYELLSPMFDEDGNELPREAPDEDPDMDEEDEDETDDVANDENYYSNYAAEANVKDEDEEGFPIVEAD